MADVRRCDLWFAAFLLVHRPQRHRHRFPSSRGGLDQSPLVRTSDWPPRSSSARSQVDQLCRFELLRGRRKREMRQRGQPAMRVRISDLERASMDGHEDTAHESRSVGRPHVGGLPVIRGLPRGRR